VQQDDWRAGPGLKVELSDAVGPAGGSSNCRCDALNVHAAFHHGVGNRQINRRKPIRLPLSEKRSKLKSVSRCCNVNAAATAKPMHMWLDASVMTSRLTCAKDQT
jgi:hypothetical protein